MNGSFFFSFFLSFFLFLGYEWGLRPPQDIFHDVLRCHYFTMGLRFALFAGWYDTNVIQPANNWPWFGGAEQMPLNQYSEL